MFQSYGRQFAGMSNGYGTGKYPKQTAGSAEPNSGQSDLPLSAVDLAAEILKGAQARAKRQDLEQMARVAGMIQDPKGKEFTVGLVDQVLRIKSPRHAARRMYALLKRYGAPSFLSQMDRSLLTLGIQAAQVAPALVMPLIRQRLRKDSSHVILSGEKQPLASYISDKKTQGVRVNLNLLGEAVLGQREADSRFAKYKEKLQSPDIDYLSIKLSSIESHISLTGYEKTIAVLKERMRALYQLAQETNSFINLDMEEYRDLDLTVDVFQSLLDEPQFKSLAAGIVLQAYLPDTYDMLKRLTRWALKRRTEGGADIKVRLVKGANLAMEQVTAAIQDWPLATYHSKLETDANYKRMVDYAMRVEHTSAVRIGIASHNLFDIAYAMLLARQREVSARVDFEMLEGMADSQAREIKSRTNDLLVYSPICRDADFDAAVAYLVRRFDENTQPGSFLGSLFNLEIGSEAWEEQKQMFLEACELSHSSDLLDKPQRNQNRNADHPVATDLHQPFENTPNTDFSIVANRAWLDSIIEEARSLPKPTIPLMVYGEEIMTDHVGQGKDPSRPGHELYDYALGDESHVHRAVNVAVNAMPTWEARGWPGRAEVLRQFAAISRLERGKTIGIMLADGGKAVLEADGEVSEAIDFAEYYARSIQAGDEWQDGLKSAPAGVTVVTPPWNFPYAIPAGGCLAALMAGNTVILKPAPETVWTAWHLANQLWAAGVPKDVLQFLPLPDNAIGKTLITHADVTSVVLTGAYETARLFTSTDWRPDLRLSAETSGKNSMIISSSADLDLAIKDLVQGAFGHSGQKCSATSLAIVMRDVYESEQFRAQLKDATESLYVAGAWDLSAQLTPLIREPGPVLKRGLTSLDPGESWLVQPTMREGNPNLWSAGIRLGVKRGSWFHQTECFGPVLGLMCVNSFEEAISVQNSSEFGLTGGLYSLDESEIAHWRKHVQVGNGYINRSTTGAIVRRQPFGGWKHSAIGACAKAGGPNYVATFRDWYAKQLPSLRLPLTPELKAICESYQDNLSGSSYEVLLASAGSYLYWWEKYFRLEHDPSGILGEDNHFRYIPHLHHTVRIPEVLNDAHYLSIAQSHVLCHLAGVSLTVSFGNDTHANSFKHFDLSYQVESDQKLVDELMEAGRGAVRIAGGEVPESLYELNLNGVRVLTDDVPAHGRIAWLQFLSEQSISETVHRHGNLINTRI